MCRDAGPEARSYRVARGDEARGKASHVTRGHITRGTQRGAHEVLTRVAVAQQQPAVQDPG